MAVRDERKGGCIPSTCCEVEWPVAGRFRTGCIGIGTGGAGGAIAPPLFPS